MKEKVMLCRVRKKSDVQSKCWHLATRQNLSQWREKTTTLGCVADVGKLANFLSGRETAHFALFKACI
jgi:hypothetical protein